MWAGPQRLPAAQEERPLPENSLRAPHPQLCSGRELPLTLPNLAWLGKRERFSFQIQFHCAITWMEKSSEQPFGRGGQAQSCCLTVAAAPQDG